MKAIYFDMDGTIADLYGVNGWLEALRAYDPSPYIIARPLVRLSSLAHVLNRLQREGYTLGVISWLSKCSNEDYDRAVTIAKVAWLKRHLPSVQWDEIIITAYGTPKEKLATFPEGILFDDNEAIRNAWNGEAFDVTDIIGILKGLK